MKFLALFAISSILVLATGCSGFESGQKGSGSVNNWGSPPTATTGPDGLEMTEMTTELGTLSASVDSTHDLGQNQTYRVVYTNSTSYTGLVQFSVDRSALDGIAGSNDIQISLNPTELNVTPGEQVNLNLIINTPFRSPSFPAQQLKVMATGTNNLAVEVPFTLSVQPVINIELRQCDYQNNATLDDCWNVPGSMDIRPHAAGVTVNFTNCDPTDDHIVHGNGSIRHQNVAQPLPQAAAADNCAGTYTVQVATDETDPGSYYMHDTQSGAQRRFINFGVQNPMAAQAAAVADDFDRGPSNTGSCHDPVGED